MTTAICGTAPFPLRRIATCPTEQRRRRFAGQDLGAWYGARWTCLGCGDTFGDGQRMERPFRRGWRQEAVAKAREVWAAAGAYSKADHEAWLREQL